MNKAEFCIFNNGLMTANTMSGSDQRVLNWSRIFSGAGHKVTVFTSAAGAARFQGLGFRVCVTGSLVLKSNVGFLLVYFSRALKSCIRAARVRFVPSTVIYSSSDLMADALPAVFLKFLRPAFPLLVGMHLIAPNPFKGFTGVYKGGLRIPSLANLYYFLFQRVLISVLKRKATLVLVSNRDDREFLIKKGFQPSRVMVTYGACDVSFGREVLSAEKTYDAVYVGRFHEQKGFPDLLKVWKRVVGHFPEAVLVVIGEDITAGDIKEFIAQNGLGRNIRFLGFVGGSRKYEYVTAARLCIFPSYYESFGMVALEAMSCGVPVVAYDLPVFRGIYGKGMIRSGVGDIDGMARNVIRLLGHEEERSKIAADALEQSRQFSWEKTASDILGHLGI